MTIEIYKNVIFVIAILLWNIIGFFIFISKGEKYKDNPWLTLIFAFFAGPIVWTVSILMVIDGVRKILKENKE